MASFSHKLVIPIIGDARSFEKALKKSIKGTDHFSSRLGRLTKGLAVTGIAAAGAATAFAIGFTVKAVKAAVSLEQSIYRVNRVFGASSGIIKKWSEGTAGTLGINRDQALEFSGGIGAMIRNFGIAPSKAAGMSKKLVTLAADMAVFNKASPEDTFSALKRGLSGMMRGLKQYNVVIDNATVKSEALRATGKKSASDLTPLEIAWARYRLILQKSQIQQGSAQKRAGTWTQVWRRIHASVHDLTEEFGVGLLPVVTRVARVLANKLADPKFRAFVRGLSQEIGKKLLGAFNRFSDWFNKNWPAIKNGFKQLWQFVKGLVRASQHLYHWYQKLQDLTGFGSGNEALQAKVAFAAARSNASPARKAAALAAVGLHVNGDIHVHGVDDPKKLAEAIHRHARKKSSQTRGRHQHAMHPH